MKKILLLFGCILVLNACSKNKQVNIKPSPLPIPIKTFKNPIIENAADPWVIQKGEYYFFLQTQGNSIGIKKSKKMSEIGKEVTTNVYYPPTSGLNAKELWAPEMFFLENKWYIYYTATDGPDMNHRMFVLENDNADPTVPTWVDRGQLVTKLSDLWAIDGTILEYKNELYFIFSGRPGAKKGDLTQNLYISKMSNPYTLSGETILISTPTYNWEKNGFAVNEGPEILKNASNDVFLIFSASYCGTDDYALGMLTLTKGEDPLVPTSWTKNKEPIFTKLPTAYGPGHNGFFTSKDGKENWIIYHANTDSHPNNNGCGGTRNTRMQKFTWNTNGTPNFGTPITIGSVQNVPSGE